MKKSYSSFAAALLALMCAAPAQAQQVLDWDKIQHWTGEGPNKAALVIQMYTEGKSNPGALVWGLRWADGENLNGEDLVRRVAEGSRDLVILTQYTGWMGNTMCGFGYAQKASDVLQNLVYDLDGAMEDSNISFGFTSANTGLGQTSYPGMGAENLVMDAIYAAEETHVIEHPLDAKAFGYACYDYDWWKLNDKASAEDSQIYWNSGWYENYPSYWVGSSTNLDDLGYSSIGMTSTEIKDGDINAWKFRPSVQGSPVNKEWLTLNYSHFQNISSVGTVESESNSAKAYYRLDGSLAGNGIEVLAPGIYVEVCAGKARKIAVK